MAKYFLIAACLVAGVLASTAIAQDPSNPFDLKPGEKLLWVEPIEGLVGQQPATINCPNGKCPLQRGPVRSAVVGAVQGTVDGILQMKANAMAARNRVFHPGGGYVLGASAEGVGSGYSPQSAIANCCYYGRRPMVGSAVAQGTNGQWFAVVQYR